MTVAKSNGTTISEPTTEINNDVENKKRSTITRMEDLMNEEDEITPEDLAPEGGWGWMIALAMILIFISTIGPTVSFTLIFTDFLKDSGQEGMATSLFNSVFMITQAIASLMTNTLLKKYSTRPVGIAGALFFAIPDIILAFVRNIYEMAFLFFFQGFGFGLIITVCNTVFNSYFVKKRTKVMSASQVIIAFGGIIFPYLTGKMMTTYGFRGTTAILGALSLNGVVGMMLMHPVEWHARKPEEIRAERARERMRNLQALALSNRRSTIDVIHESFKTRWSSLRSLKEENSNQVPLLSETFKTSAHRVASISAIEDIRGRAKSLSMRENLVRRMSVLSASSLVNVATSASTLGDVRQSLEKKSREKHMEMKETEVEEKQDDENKEEEETKCRIFLKDFLDMSLIKDYCFINLCLGISTVSTADYAFSSFVPLIMSDIGYTTDQTSLTLTVNGVAEMMSKILLTIMALMVNVKSKYLFFAAVICMGFARTGFLLYQRTITGVFIMTAIIGAVRSWLMVLQPLVIMENTSIEKFALAYGIYSVISGMIGIVCGAIVGLIKDWTNSYDIYQISLLILNGAFVIPWALQFIFVDFKQWRKQRAQKITTNSLL
nr:PREDICTED: monocarboxylate transporter 9 [Linepithema humile]XP_012228845.1 PREDICTED: monocarboxylate transporter 9 [Linepithema humile]